MLTSAAEAIIAEIEKLAAWEGDLLDDLGATREKREALLRAADPVLAILPPDGRRPFRLRLNRVAIAVAGGLRAKIHVTDKVEAVHDYLARAEGVVTVKAVQRYLKAHGLAPYDDAAALLLARKCKQGLLERVGRGRYRVNRHHPVVAGALVDDAPRAGDAGEPRSTPLAPRAAGAFGSIDNGPPAVRS